VTASMRGNWPSCCARTCSGRSITGAGSTDAQGAGAQLSDISKDLGRVMSRLKAIYRSWGSLYGKQVYAPRYRADGWRKSVKPGCAAGRSSTTTTRRPAASAPTGAARAVAEAKKHGAWKLLRGFRSSADPGGFADCFDPDTPPFPYQATVWTYSGFGIQTYSSAEHRCVQGELRRSKKPVSIRGLNRNHNHDLKNLFQECRDRSAAKPGPFQEFMMRWCPRESARNGAPDSSAEDCSNHVDHLEKRSALRRPTSETTNSLSVSEFRSIPRIDPGGGSSSS